MKFNRLLNKLSLGLVMLCGLSFASCEAGLTYEEVPESVYTEVGVSGTPFVLRARQQFPEQLWATNWNKYAENYQYTQQISWEAKLTEEADATVKGGTLYVINVKANTKVTYSSPNKGFLFDGSKMGSDAELIDPVTVDGKQMSQKVKMPVKQKEVIGEINLVAQYDCVVERVDGASKLGVPADFTKPNRYLVKNICYLPDGVEQSTRLYEVRVTFVDQQ